MDSLPSKRLRDAFSLESKRGPAAAEATRERERLARERDRLRREEDEAERAPLSNDELRALTMPRKHAEVGERIYRRAPGPAGRRLLEASQTSGSLPFALVVSVTPAL